MDMQFMVEYSNSGFGVSDLGLSLNHHSWSYDIFGSSSHMKSWMKRLVDMYYYGPQYAQVSMTLFGDEAITIFNHSSYHSKGIIYHSNSLFITTV